jgi:hypothetical protein
MRPLQATGRGVGVVAGIVTALSLAGCSGTGPGASVQSPTASTVSSSPTPSAVPSPVAADVRLVIEDVLAPEVRLARFDATRTARVPGLFDGIVAGKVIVVNGRTLESLSRDGTVKVLGHLAATPLWSGPGTVAVKPDLSQWMYTIADASWTARIHLGSATGDRVVATIPSPDGNAFYRPFTWNASGVYMVRQLTGIGGAGPFLEYHFDLATFDASAGKVTDVSPDCLAYQVLDDGTLVCGVARQGYLEVRSPAGQTRKIQVTIGGAENTYDAWAYSHVALSSDGKRLIAARNGAQDPVVNYQMAVADLTASSATSFGPIDYVPDAWLPDGRLVADHMCVQFEGAGPCDAGLDGTYIFSADGLSRTFFYKLKQGSSVVGYL